MNNELNPKKYTFFSKNIFFQTFFFFTNKVVTIIQGLFDKLVGKQLNFLVDKIIDEVDKVIIEKNTSQIPFNSEIAPNNDDAMKFVIKSYLLSQNDSTISIGTENEIIKKVNKMSHEDIKQTFEVIDRTVNYCSKLVFENPSKECTIESKTLQLSIDHLNEDKKD